jgi:hypothetical protein
MNVKSRTWRKCRLLNRTLVQFSARISYRLLWSTQIRAVPNKKWVPSEYNGFVPPNGPRGFRNQSGKTVIASRFLEPGRFSEGLATVQVGPWQKFARHRLDDPAYYHPENYAYIDRSGNWRTIRRKLSMLCRSESLTG